MVNLPRQRISTKYLFYLPRVRAQKTSSYEESQRNIMVLLLLNAISWEWLALILSAWSFIKKKKNKKQWLTGILLCAENTRIIGCGLFHKGFYYLRRKINIELILRPCDRSCDIGRNHTLYEQHYAWIPSSKLHTVGAQWILGEWINGWTLQVRKSGSEWQRSFLRVTQPISSREGLELVPPTCIHFSTSQQCDLWNLPANQRVSIHSLTNQPCLDGSTRHKTFGWVFFPLQ